MNNDINDNQKLASDLVNLVLQRVYTKLAPDLTDEDIQKLEDLDKNDPTGESAREFLLSKFPDFDNLFEIEMENLKRQVLQTDHDKTLK
jgi:hypothetical protein